MGICEPLVYKGEIGQVDGSVHVTSIMGLMRENITVRIIEATIPLCKSVRE